MTVISIKKGRIEKPEGFLRLLVPMEQERCNMALLGSAEGLYVEGGSCMLLEVSTGGKSLIKIRGIGG